MVGRGLLCLVLVVGMTACTAPLRTVSPPPPSGPPPTPDVGPPRPAVVGKASWYGAFHHGKRTASGEVFDMHALTAAHRTLPLGTRVRVTHLRNGKSVEVRVNDRGPVIRGRIIDLSRGAAARLDAVDDGVFPVEVLVLNK
jgi:rare lipoprotein A